MCQEASIGVDLLGMQDAVASVYEVESHEMSMVLLIVQHDFRDYES